MSGKEVGCETDSSEGSPESLAHTPPQVFALTSAKEEETDAGQGGEEIDDDISNASGGAPESVVNLELAPFGERRAIANEGNGGEPAGVGACERGMTCINVWMENPEDLAGDACAGAAIKLGLTIYP